MLNPITGQSFVPGGGQLFSGTVNEDGSATLLNRLCIETNNGQSPIAGEGYPIQQTDVSAITYGILNRSTGLWVAQNQPLTVSAVIFDSLQQGMGPIWVQDEIGYNFRHALPPASFPAGKCLYRYEAQFTLAAGGTFWIRWDLLAGEIYTAG
ncbi:MAG: hypothetical protein KGL39_07985 [Patescibacteria group bacterium]|nr:hypothetical protein [Patescibacteria group bacterium]